ncbi:MAG TPA: putative Ig domain-containing protein [Chitinophagaceae bacterium]|nr:putative Ig domain-containing protein [Chitinophagaceae bacterium]
MRVIFTITLAAICGNIYTTAFCQEKPGPQLYFTTRENSRVQANTAYYYQCTAFDSADHALTYTAENLPAWLTFNTGTHTLTGKTQSAGQYPVTLAVSNGAATARQHFMLTVGDENTANILCLGNSITNGTSKFNSYRRLLWQMLHKSNYNFDMVGSWSKHHAGGEVPNPDFDMDHEGHSGWTTGHVFHPPGWTVRAVIYSSGLQAIHLILY